MSGAKEKTKVSQDQSDGTKNRVPQKSNEAMTGKKAQTPVSRLPQPGTSRVVQRTSPNTNETTKEKLKKKAKSKENRPEPQTAELKHRSEKRDISEEEDLQWFQEEEEDEEDKGEGTWITKGKVVKDNWEETTEHEEDSEDERLGNAKVNPEVQGTMTEGSRKNSQENETAKKPEDARILTRITKADKAMMKALFKIASIVGENREVQEQVDNVLTAHSKLKNIVMEQSQEIAFHKGRITELERKTAQPGGGPLVHDTEEDGPKESQQKPSYALVVSSGHLQKKQVAKLIKEQVDLTRLDIQDATMRPGREGIVITTSSKEAVGKLEAQLQRKPALQQLQIKKPSEHLYNIKIIGIDEDTDFDTLTETVVKQNQLTCQPTDLKVQKRWKGRQGATVVIALNRRGVNAIQKKTHVNIGWDRCPVYEHFFVPRCVKCGEHGHTVNGCDGPSRCLNCGREGHRQEDCASTARCRVCEREERNNTEHSTMSWTCPSYCDKLEAEKRRILARLN